MTASQAATVIDLNDYRQRRQAQASRRQPAAAVAPQGLMWCQVWVMLPMWYYPVPAAE